MQSGQNLGLLLHFRYFIENEYYQDKRIPLGHLSFNVCDERMMIAQLSHILLNPFFKPKQRKWEDKQNCYKNTSYCLGSKTSIGEFCNCKICKCTEPYSSNILVILSYLPIHHTKLATSLMRGEHMPFFAFSNQELILSQLKEKFFEPMYSTYELGRFFFLRYLDRNSAIKHIAFVDVGKFSNSLANYHQNQIWNEILRRGNVCIQKKYLDPSNITEIKQYIDYIRHDKTLQVIIIWIDYKYLPMVIELTNNINDRLWYWYTNNPYFLQATMDYNISFESLKTHYIVQHPVYSLANLNEAYSYENMDKFMYKESYEIILNDKWISGYMSENGMNKSESHVFKSFDNITTLDSMYVESLITLIWAKYSRHPDIIKEWEWLRSFAVILQSKKRLGKKGYFVETMSTEKLNLSHVNQKSICVILKCHPGYEPKYEQFYDEQNDIERVNWHCVVCEPNTIKPHYSTNYCQKCKGYLKPNGKRTKCFDPYTAVYLQINDQIVIVILIIVSCGIFLNVITLVTFICYKSTPVVRSSGLNESLLQLSVQLMLFIAMPVLFLNKPTWFRCFTQPLLVGDLLSVVTTVTMTKTIKALNAFKARLVLSKREVIMTKTIEWFVLILVVVIQVLIFGISFYQVSPDVGVVLSEEKLTRDVYCSNLVHLQIQLAYVVMLSMFCLMQAFRGRNLPGRFNESTRATYSMLFTILILGITFTIINSQPKGKDISLVTIISVTLINIIQLLFMYSYKVFVIVFRPNKNTKKAFQLSMMRHAREESSRVISYNSSSQ